MNNTGSSNTALGGNALKATQPPTTMPPLVSIGLTPTQAAPLTHRQWLELALASQRLPARSNNTASGRALFNNTSGSSNTAAGGTRCCQHHRQQQHRLGYQCRLANLTTGVTTCRYRQPRGPARRDQHHPRIGNGRLDPDGYLLRRRGNIHLDRAGKQNHLGDRGA